MEETKTTQNSNNTVIIAVVAVLVIGGIAAFAMSRNNTASNTPAQTTQMETDSTSPAMEAGSETSQPPSGESTKTEGEVKVLELEGESFYYKPNEIRVKKGEKVKVVLNSVSMMHDFVIDELNVRTPIVKSGESGTVEFTADQVGTFEYYCSVGQHRANGQVGKLIVEE